MSRQLRRVLRQFRGIGKRKDQSLDSYKDNQDFKEYNFGEKEVQRREFDIGFCFVL